MITARLVSKVGKNPEPELKKQKYRIKKQKNDFDSGQVA